MQFSNKWFCTVHVLDFKIYKMEILIKIGAFIKNKIIKINNTIKQKQTNIRDKSQPLNVAYSAKLGQD